MSDRELEEYIRKIDVKFDSHIEKGTIEMSNEYYNLVEERMARLIDKNKQLKEIRESAINYIDQVLMYKPCAKEIDEELNTLISILRGDFNE